MISRFFKSINNLPFYFKIPVYFGLLVVSFIIILYTFIFSYNAYYEHLLYGRLRPSDMELLVQKEDWKDTTSGRFAHSLNYEDKLAKPVPFEFNDKAKFEDESIRYFEHLCSTEGKEYIYKTADNVTSVAQLRSFEYPKINPKINYDPRIHKSSQKELIDIYNDRGLGNVTSFHNYVYTLEAPLFFDENRMNPYFSLYMGSGNVFNNKNFGGIYRLPYPNYEILFNNGKIYNYYYDNEEFNKPKNGTLYQKFIHNKEVKEINSEYGWTWRGFSRPNDRQLGIAGGDIIIMELKTNQIIAIQRGFVKAFVDIPNQNLNWSGIGCFNHYKNYSLNKKLNFEDKNFKSKYLLIKHQEITPGVLVPFLHKILSPTNIHNSFAH